MRWERKPVMLTVRSAFGHTRLLGAFILVLLAAAPSFAEQLYRNVDAAELQRLLDRGVTVVDVRTPEEWRSTGVIADSRRIMAFDSRGEFDPSFPQALGTVAGPDEEIVLICWSGQRSRVLAEALSRQAGYARIYHAEGGLSEWLDQKRPVDACEDC